MSRPSDSRGSGSYQLHPGFEFRTVPNPSAGDSDFVGTVPGHDDVVRVTDPATLLTIEEGLNPVSRDELIERVAERTGSRPSTVAERVDRLIAASVLIPAESDRTARLHEWVENGWLESLHYHLRTRTGYDGDDAVASETNDREASEPHESAASEPPERDRSDESSRPDVRSLPDPDPLPDLPLRTVLLERETCRNFDGERLSASSVANVLGHGSVTVPEGGNVVEASAPDADCFDAYVVSIRTPGLDRGIYRYDSQAHRLEVVERRPESPEALDQRVEDLLISQPYARGAAFLLVVTANYGAIRSRFDGPRDLRSAYAALSMRAHRFLLAATAFDVATFQTGAYHETEFKEFLSLDHFDVHPEFTLAFGGTDDE